MRALSEFVFSISSPVSQCIRVDIFIRNWKSAPAKCRQFIIIYCRKISHLSRTFKPIAVALFLKSRIIPKMLEPVCSVGESTHQFGEGGEE